MKALAKRWRVAVLAVVLIVAGIGIGRLAYSNPTQNPEEPYRVELVMTDQYKVARALNQMADQGWYFISSVPRNDGKVLLVFRRGE